MNLAIFPSYCALTNKPREAQVACHQHQDTSCEATLSAGSITATPLPQEPAFTRLFEWALFRADLLIVVMGFGVASASVIGIFCFRGLPRNRG